MACKLDGVASQVRMAQATKEMQPAMKNAVAGIGRVLKSTDMEKLVQTMDSFEAQFGEIKVQGELMSTTISNATATSTPVDQVDQLVKQVADEHGLALVDQLDQAGAVPTSSLQETVKEVDADEEDVLEGRLKKLREAAA